MTRLDAMQAEIDRLRVTLVTLLIWMSGSAASPLRHDELQRLVDLAEGRLTDQGPYGPRHPDDEAS